MKSGFKGDEGVHCGHEGCEKEWNVCLGKLKTMYAQTDFYLGDLI